MAFVDVDVALNLRRMVGAIVGLALISAEASGQGPADAFVEPPVDASPAPVFAPSTRARLVDVLLTATSAPVWPDQIGPAAFVDRFAAPALDQRWHRHDREPNASWAENDWRAENVVMRSPGLSLVMSKSDGEGDAVLSSGEIHRVADFRYGYFESRIKVPRGDGVITAFFTYVREDGTRKTWNEIDVEILGRDTRTVEFTIHVDGKSVNRKIDLGFDAAEGFHTYAIEWRPDAVLWYVDNKLAHSMTGHLVEKLRRPQAFHIDVWGTDELRGWAGRIDPEAGPWELQVDCMAYRPSYEGEPMCGD